MQFIEDGALFRQQAFVGGKWEDADAGGTVEVVNPANGRVIGTVPAMGRAETERAIAAAAAAFPAWRAYTASERAVVLERLFDLIVQHTEDLARLLTLEQGKPLTEARGELVYGRSFVKWFAEEARRVYGITIPSPVASRRIVVSKEPVGVCGIITPWNFPIAMITRKIAPALAAGCTVVIKPSEFTPFSALALAVLCERAGVPAGVVNVVTGMPIEIGKTMTASATVRKISFTGSTRIGALLMRESGDTVKRLSLELGGNAPFVVFDDADIGAAVAGVLASKFRNGGQTCVSANRILVQSAIYDSFAERLAASVAALKVGSGFDEGTEIGPMINEAAVAKIDRHIADALAKGAKRMTQARNLPREGSWATPTVLRDATFDMLCAAEETFGPVAPLFRFETEEEAIRLANDTPFGLAAYFFSNGQARCWRVGSAIEAGMIGVNTGMISTEVAPFGGVKQSGLGREGSYLGIDEYLEVKTLHLDGL